MTDLKPEDPDCAALMERLEAWAAKERHDARHVRGPAFHPPWGQDIIDRHNQNAADLTLALSLLADRARMEKAHQRLVDDLVAKANEARALAADLHNKPAKAHLADPALERMAYAMAAKCDHFIEAAEIARQALGASQ